MNKGKISLSRLNDGTIQLEIVDEQSGSRFLRATMTAETLGLLVTGLSYLDCEFDLRGLSVLGKRREIKDESITVSGMHPTLDEVLQHSAQYEVDGWTCLFRDGNRQLNADRKGNMRVPFVRYVDNST